MIANDDQSAGQIDSARTLAEQIRKSRAENPDRSVAPLSPEERAKREAARARRREEEQKRRREELIAEKKKKEEEKKRDQDARVRQLMMQGRELNEPEQQADDGYEMD